MAGSYPIQRKRSTSRAAGALLPSVFLLGACVTPKPPPTTVWISAQLKKTVTADDQWVIDCAMLDDCVAGDCDRPYSPPVKRGSPPHDEWVTLANGQPDKEYQVRLRVRKAAPPAQNSVQKPESHCRTGIVRLCSDGLRQFTASETPWLNIQLSDELTLDGPNVLIVKGFTNLVSAERNTSPTATKSQTLSFRNVNGKLEDLCLEEEDMQLGPTWFAAKFSWPSPREDCPTECPAASSSLSPQPLASP